MKPAKRVCVKECLVFPNCDCSLAWAWREKNKSWPKPRYRLKMKKIVGQFLYGTTIDWYCYLVTDRIGGSKDSDLDYIGSIEHSTFGVTHNYNYNPFTS